MTGGHEPGGAAYEPGAGRRVTRRAVLAAGLTLGLTACHGLPTSSPVRQGAEVGRGQPDGVRIIPRGPVPGSDPRGLVLDFLRAGVGVDDDSGVARTYLTPEASAQWHPDGSAVIYEDPSALRVTATGPGRVVVAASVAAVLDADGHYVEVASGQTRTATLQLEQRDGEWRIHRGVESMPWTWISRADFGLYSSYSLTYATPDGNGAVTDQRWLLQGPGLLTRLARAQLAPPPTYLQGAVTTGAPEYTDLSLGAVTVDNGIAQVPLTARALNADDRGRRLLWQQLTATLTSGTGVDGVQVTADGSRLSASGVGDRPMTPGDVTLVEPSAPTAPVIRRSAAGLERLDPTVLSLVQGQDRQLRQQARRPQGAPLPTIGRQWWRLAASPAGDEIAGVSGDLRSLGRWRGGKHVAYTEIGRDLTRPAYDGRGYLWSGGRTAGGERILVVPVDDLSGRPPVMLAVPWLAGRSLVAVRPAADGQRLLVVSRDDRTEQATVSVAGVLRKDARPVGLARPMEVAGSLSRVTDATWLDAQSIGVVGRVRPGDDQRVVLAAVGGPSQVLGAVRGATAITSFGGTRNIVVSTEQDEALVRSGNSFVPLVPASDFLVPGH